MADDRGRQARVAPLVGRARELAALRTGITAAAGGAATVVVLTGPFGIGKTRLAREGLALCTDAGFTVLEGRSSGGGSRGAITSALGGWLRHQPSARLAPVVSGLPQLALLFSDLPVVAPPPLADAALERSRIEDGQVRLLERLARVRPVALLLDDLHLADASTWSTTQQLLAELGDQPVVLIVTASLDAASSGSTREGGVYDGAGPGLDTIRRGLRAEGWHLEEIELGPLGDRDAVDLVSTLASSAGEIAPSREAVAQRSGLRHDAGVAEAVRRCAGRPLFLESVAGCLAEGLGPTLSGDVQAQLLDRIRLLEPIARTVLDLLAVAGTELSAEVIVTAVQCNYSGADLPKRGAVLEALDGLARRRMVRADDAYDLAHAFLRDTVRANVNRTELRQIQVALANAIERHHLDDPEQSRNLIDAVPLLDPRRAYALLRATAGRARGIGASEEAARLLRTAADTAGRLGAPRERAETLAELGDVLAWSRAPADAAIPWGEALAAYTSADDPIGIARAHRRLGELAWENGDTGTARSHLEAAEQSLSGLAASAEQAELYFAQMVAATRTEDDVSLREVTDRLVRLAGELDTPSYVARAQLAVGSIALAAGDLVSAAGSTRRALVAAEAAGAPTLLTRAHDQLSVIAGSEGDIAGLRQHSEASLAVAHRIGSRTGEGWPLLRIAVAELLSGDWDAALRGTSEVVAGAERLHAGRGLASALALHGWVLTHRGRLAEAAEFIGRARRVVSSSLRVDRHIAWTAGVAGVRLALAEGDPRAAVRAADLIGRPVRGWLSLLALATWAEAAVAAGDLDTARDLAAEARATISAATIMPGTVEAWIGGSVAAAEGDTATAVSLLGRATDGFESLGLPFQTGCSLLAQAEVSDDAALAIHRAGGALRVFDTLGAPIQAQRARLLLRRLGVVPSRGRPAARGGSGQGIVELSARELDVARLVAAGLRNAEIATRLFISPRTVGTHLEHVYRRLGLSSRAALTRYLADSGLLDPPDSHL